MSQTNPNKKVQERFHKSCTQLFDFAIPVGRNGLNVKDNLKHWLNDHNMKFVDQLSSQRNEMMLRLSSGASSDVKLGYVDIYLPSILCLYKSTKDNEKLGFDVHRIGFGLSKMILADCSVLANPGILFEVVTTLSIKAFLHHTAARELLCTSFSDSLTDAGKHLLTAASVMQFIYEHFSSGKWAVTLSSAEKNKDAPIFPMKTYLALSLLFKSSAQTLAVVRALGDDKTSAAFKAGLCVAVQKGMGRSLDVLRDDVTAPTFPQRTALMTHIAMMRELYAAITCLYLSQSCTERNDLGLATAYCHAAKKHLIQQAAGRFRPQGVGLPCLQTCVSSATSDHMSFTIAMLQTKVDVLQEHVERENNCIYFQVVPSTLPELPAEISVVQVPLFVEPIRKGPSGEDEDVLVFEYVEPLPPAATTQVEKRSGIFGFMRSSSSSSSSSSFSSTSTKSKSSSQLSSVEQSSGKSVDRVTSAEDVVDEGSTKFVSTASLSSGMAGLNLSAIDSAPAPVLSQPTPSIAPARKSSGASRLSFSDNDVDQFIRIFSKSKDGYRYGRLTSYDPASMQHVVVFSDGKQSQRLDLAKQTFEVLDVPNDVKKGFGRGTVQANVDASRAVAAWHSVYLLTEKCLVPSSVLPGLDRK